MIELSQKGNFSKATSHLERLKEIAKMGILDKYGREGVRALSEATPVDTGKTASSWSYKIKRDRTSFILSFHNSNVVDGVPIAVIIQYGHGTKGGGYVQGRDYINPVMRPLFDKMLDELQREVNNA